MPADAANDTTIDPALLDGRFAIPDLEDWDFLGSTTAFNVDIDDLSPSGPLQAPFESYATFREAKELSPGRDSNASWNEQDENHGVHLQMDRKMRALILSNDTNSFHTPPLTSKERRDLHVMARVLQLGHKTIRTDAVGSRRCMLIFKDVLIGEDQQFPATGNNQSALNYQLPVPGLCSGPLDPHIAMDPTASEVEPAASSTVRSRKPAGKDMYECSGNNCDRKFRRACDRNKHEKLHGPKNNLPHRCMYNPCQKAFLYPKDLRRHEEVHQRRGDVFAEQAVGDMICHPPSPSALDTNGSAVDNRDLYVSWALSLARPARAVPEPDPWEVRYQRRSRSPHCVASESFTTTQTGTAVRRQLAPRLAMRQTILNSPPAWVGPPTQLPDPASASSSVEQSCVRQEMDSDRHSSNAFSALAPLDLPEEEESSRSGSPTPASRPSECCDTDESLSRELESLRLAEGAAGS